MINDFILEIDEIASKEWCKNVTDLFESVNYVNRSEFLGVSPLQQENQVYHMLNDTVRLKSNLPILREFNDMIKHGLDIYMKQFPMLNEIGRFNLNPDVKIQRTKPGEGYHIWHCEHDSFSRKERLLLCMIYLNDVPDGGETEFLNQQRRIKPKMGKLVICPAFWTHFHRGNPPIGGDKYMINGWLEFVNV